MFKRNSATLFHASEADDAGSSHNVDEQGLTCSLSRKSGLLVVKPAGMIDEQSVHALRHSFHEVYSTKSKVVVMDMARVPLVDSEGLGALINLQKRLVESGRKLVLVGCQEPVRAALSLTRLEVLFPHYPTLASVPLA